MSRRAVYIGLLLVASQLASGCCCFRTAYWRWRCAPCNGGACAPALSARIAMPPISSPPIASAPLLPHGPIGADCPTCAAPPVGAYAGYPGPGYVGPAGGVPVIGSPIPLGSTGPSVESSRELPNPMPVNPKDKN